MSPAMRSFVHHATKAPDNITDKERGTPSSFPPPPPQTVTYRTVEKNKTTHTMIHKALLSNCYHLSCLSFSMHYVQLIPNTSHEEEAKEAQDLKRSRTSFSIPLPFLLRQILNSLVQFSYSFCLLMMCFVTIKVASTFLGTSQRREGQIVVICLSVQVPK